MSMRLSSLRGLSALSLSTIVAKGAWFAFFVVVCGRLLPTRDYGALLTALSLATLAAAVFEGGFYVVAARFVAQRSAQAYEEVSRLLSLRLMVGSVALGAGMALAALAGWERELVEALVGATFYVTGLGVRGVLRAVLEMQRRLSSEAGFLLLERAACIGLAFGALAWWERSARAVLLGLALGQLVTCLFQVVWLRAQGSPVRLAWPTRGWSQALARSSLLVAATGMMNTFYSRSDQLLVERLLGTQAAGEYGMMYQVLLALGMFTTLFTDSYLYPRFSVWYRDAHADRVRRIAVWSSAALFVGGLGVVGLVHAGAEWGFATAQLHAYLVAVPVLNVLIWSFPLYGVHLVLNAALLAAFQERGLLAALALGGCVSVVGVLTQASRGLEAVARVTVLTELVVVLASGALFARVYFRHVAVPK